MKLTRQIDRRKEYTLYFCTHVVKAKRHGQNKMPSYVFHKRRWMCEVRSQSGEGKGASWRVLIAELIFRPWRWPSFSHLGMGKPSFQNQFYDYHKEKKWGGGAVHITIYVTAASQVYPISKVLMCQISTFGGLTPSWCCRLNRHLGDVPGGNEPRSRNEHDKGVPSAWKFQADIYKCHWEKQKLL